MGFLDSVRDARTRRAQAKAQRAYTAAVDMWAAQCDRAARLVLIAEDPRGRRFSSMPVALGRGEVPLMGTVGFTLIAPRNQLVRDWVGTSYRLSDKSTVRAGHSTMYATVDQPAPIDQGTVVITNQRVVFMGRTRSIEWPYRRVVGVTHDPSDRWTAIHVTSRQRLNGFGHPASHADDVRFFLALGMAMYRGEGQAFADELGDQALSLFHNPPIAAAGVHVDKRVRYARQVRATADAMADQQTVQPSAVAPQQIAAAVQPVTVIESAKSEPIAEPEPAPVLGFGSTHVAVVAAVLERFGFVVARVVPDPATRTAKDLADALRVSTETDGKRSAAVIHGDAEFVAAYLDGLAAADLLVVCAAPDLLDELAIDDVEDRPAEPLVSAYVATEPTAVVATLQSDGVRVHTFRLDDELGADDAALANTGGRIGRWLTPGPQAAVVSGPVAAFEAFLAELTAFDSVAYCGTTADAARLDIAIADQAAVPIEVDEAPAVGSTEPITVGGRTVANPLAVVTQYVIEHPGTIRNFDLAAGTSAAVTPEVIRATRRPWMNSRISAAEEAWFIDRARTAPWDTVPVDAQLRDADPTEVGGLYDQASVLYDHFFKGAPARVSIAKVSKVLHFMRPGLVPIFDSRLVAAYEPAARQAARDIAAIRPDYAKYRVLRWEAVRRDLLANEQPLKQLRRALAVLDVPLAAEFAAKVSDVRLLDVLTWDRSDDEDSEADE